MVGQTVKRGLHFPAQRQPGNSCVFRYLHNFRRVAQRCCGGEKVGRFRKVGRGTYGQSTLSFMT